MLSRNEITDSAILKLLGDHEPVGPALSGENVLRHPMRRCPVCTYEMPVELHRCPQCQRYLPPIVDGRSGF